jgi:hypothetical protein
MDGLTLTEWVLGGQEVIGGQELEEPAAALAESLPDSETIFKHGGLPESTQEGGRQGVDVLVRNSLQKEVEGHGAEMHIGNKDNHLSMSFCVGASELDQTDAQLSKEDERSMLRKTQGLPKPARMYGFGHTTNSFQRTGYVMPPASVEGGGWLIGTPCMSVKDDVLRQAGLHPYSMSQLPDIGRVILSAHG